MNDEGARHRRPRLDQVTRPTEITTVRGRETVREFVDRLEVRGRLQAIVAELARLDLDVVDVPITIARGLLDDLDEALST